MSSNKHHSHCAQYLHWVGNKIHSCGTSLDSWDRNSLFDSHVQLQTFILVKITNGTGSGDPEQILSYPATCSGCCRTSTMHWEAFYASVISDFIIFASSCSLHLSTLELYVSDLLQPIRLVQFIMASNHACHCILHDNWTNMSNTNNITITC